jgi:hypothetical protein
MKTVIVLISVNDFTDGRKIADRIQQETFGNSDEIRKAVRAFEESKDKAEVGVYDLNSFMEACNEEEIDLVNYWVSYAKVKKLF